MSTGYRVLNSSTFTLYKKKVNQMKFGQLLVSTLTALGHADMVDENFDTIVNALNNVEFVHGKVEATVRVFGAEIKYGVEINGENFDEEAFTSTIDKVIKVGEQFKGDAVKAGQEYADKLRSSGIELD